MKLDPKKTFWVLRLGHVDWQNDHDFADVCKGENKQDIEKLLKKCSSPTWVDDNGVMKYHKKGSYLEDYKLPVEGESVLEVNSLEESLAHAKEVYETTEKRYKAFFDALDTAKV